MTKIGFDFDWWIHTNTDKIVIVIGILSILLAVFFYFK